MDPDYVSKEKKKLGGHAECPYRVLKIATWTFVIQRGNEVERVNIDSVTSEPDPMYTALFHAEYETPDDLQEKKVEDHAWLVLVLLGHRVENNEKLYFKVEWVGRYEDP